MQWLVLSYFLSIGTLSYNAQVLTMLGPAEIATPDRTFQTTLGVELQAFDNHLFAGGSVQTWETIYGLVFAPSESLYVFSAGIRFDGLELGYRHECDHLTLSEMILPMKGFGGNRDEIYLNYMSKLKVF